MKKKVIKRTLISIIVSAFVFTSMALVSGVGIYGRCSIRVSDYDEFYVYKKDTVARSFLDFGGGGAASGYTVWFLPGQKGKMLDRIKQDVHDELTDMVESNSDLFKGVEISDDFHKVHVYYYKDTWSYALNPDSARRIDELTDIIYSQTVQLKIELYHEVISGGNHSFSENIMYMVEVE